MSDDNQHVIVSGTDAEAVIFCADYGIANRECIVVVHAMFNEKKTILLQFNEKIIGTKCNHYKNITYNNITSI